MSKTADSGIDEQQRQAAIADAYALLMNEGLILTKEKSPFMYAPPITHAGEELLTGANGEKYWTKPKAPVWENPILCVTLTSVLSQHEADRIKAKLSDAFCHPWKVVIIDCMTEAKIQAFIPQCQP